MGTLPEAIMVDIFARLPLSSVLRLQCLSKQWLSTLREDYFRDLHAERSPETVLFSIFELIREAGRRGVVETPVINMSCLAASRKTPPVHSIIRLKEGPQHRSDGIAWFHYRPCAPCNGLICMRPACGYDASRPILVCNPLTAEYIALPAVATGGFFRFSVGLGYSRVSKQYKVVCILEKHGDNTAPAEMRVHTLGADAGWRKVHVAVGFQPQYCPPFSVQILVDGKMYSVISEDDACRLLSLDVETEELTKTDIDVPSLRSKTDTDYLLVPLGTDQVSMLIRDKPSMCIEEWVMLRHGAWRLRRRFDLRPHYGPNNDLGLMWAVSKVSGSGDKLSLFEGITLHIHNGHIASYGSHGQYDYLNWSVCVGYKPSLFSLASFGSGYEIQKWERFVDLDKKLIPPPDIGLWPLMEQEPMPMPISPAKTCVAQPKGSILLVGNRAKRLAKGLGKWLSRGSKGIRRPLS